MIGRKRTRPEEEPTLHGDVVNQWWFLWSTALMERMKCPETENLSLRDHMSCRLSAMEISAILPSAYISYLYHWTFDRACDVTDITFARWRWHVLWVLQKCGLPADVCRQLVRNHLWNSQEAYDRGARMMKRLFYWDSPLGEEKKLKWLLPFASPPPLK